MPFSAALVDSISATGAPKRSTPSPSKLAVLDPPRIKLSRPRCSPPPCESRTPPSSPHNPLNRRDVSILSFSGQNCRRGSFPVATVFCSVSCLSGRCFKFYLCSSSSCALSFALGTNRIAETSSPEPERPPDRAVSVASDIRCFPEPCSVSTTLPNPCGSSLDRRFALYRILMAGRWSAMEAVRR